MDGTEFSMNTILAFITGIPLPLVTWMLPICWLLHSLEEISMIDRWEMGRETEHRVIARKSWFARWILDAYSISRGPFIISTAIIGLIVLGATIAGTVDLDGFGLWIYAVILGGFFLHGFVHLGETIVLRGYTPGILTGLFVVFPGCWYLYRRLIESQLVNLNTAILTSLMGALIFLPATFGIRYLLRALLSTEAR